MFAPFEADRSFTVKYLALFLSVVLVLGLLGHYTGLGSDPYGVIHFAQHLSRGKFYSDYPVYGWFKPDWKTGRYMVLYGNYQLRDGRMFCKYTIGYSLLLAASLKILGPSSIYFFNVFLLVILLLVYYLFAREVLPDRPGRSLLALCAPALLILLIGKVWDTAVKPVHDLPALLLLVGGLYLCVRALGGPRRISWGRLALGTCALGFSGSFRLPNVLVAVPAAVYLLSRLIGSVRFGKICLLAVVALLFFALGLLPALVQNQLTTGHPLKPPRPEVVEKKAVKIDDLWHPPPLWIGFFPHTFPDVMEFFWEEYGLLFSLLIVLGAISAFGQPGIRYLCVGVPLVFILFYSCWVPLMARYLMIAEPFLVLLAVCGIGRLLQGKVPRFVRLAGPVLLAADLWIRLRLRLPYPLETVDLLSFAAGLVLWLLVWRNDDPPVRLKILSLVLLAGFLVAKGPLLLARRELFQLPDARRFGRAFDRIVPAGSVVFATKPLTQLVALFTSSHSIRPFDIERLGVPLREGVNNALDRSVGLYLIDNLGSGKEPDTGNFIPVLREDFDLIPVGRLQAADYNLRPQFGQAVCTVYRIEPWQLAETEVALPIVSAGNDCLLTLYARRLWAPDRGRTRLEAEINGRPLPAAIVDGVNFIPVPKDSLRAPLSRLLLRSDRPLPRLLEAAVQDARADYTVDLGRRAKIPDRYFISDFFDLGFGDGHFRRLEPGRSGSVLVPHLPLPDSVLVGEVEVNSAQAAPRPLRLSIDAGGERPVSFDLSLLDSWRRLVFPLSAVPLRHPLVFTADYPDRPQLGYKEKKRGALMVSVVRILRWFQKAVLPTPERDYYFTACTLRSDPSRPVVEGPCAIFCNGTRISSAVPETVSRLIIPPEIVSPPESFLMPGACPPGEALIGGAPFLLRSSSRLAVDLGADDDWAFVGEGFHSPEWHLGAVPVRWTSETATVHVPLFPQEGKTAVITFRIVPIRPAASLPAHAAARLYLDGKDLGPAGLSASADALSWSVPLDFPKPRVVALTLAVPPWRPLDYQRTTDARLLGLMLDGVEVEYGSKEK